MHHPDILSFGLGGLFMWVMWMTSLVLRTRRSQNASQAWREVAIASRDLARILQGRTQTSDKPPSPAPAKKVYKRAGGSLAFRMTFDPEFRDAFYRGMAESRLRSAKANAVTNVILTQARELEQTSAHSAVDNPLHEKRTPVA